jgi:hypothetical protein
MSPPSEPKTIIDPTKNVLDLVAAGRIADAKLREADVRFNDSMAKAEKERLDQLAAQKLMFDLELAKVLRANQDAASTLLATQLKEVKNDLSDRVSKLEQFRWETGGKSQGVSLIGAIITGIILAVTAAIGAASFVLAVLHRGV